MADAERAAERAVWTMPLEDPKELAELVEFWRALRAPSPHALGGDLRVLGRSGSRGW